MGSPLPPGCASRFLTERLLGEGGFGAVWLARQVGLDRPVAVKVIRADAGGDPLGRERFLAEARITASLDHEAIVKVIDHDVEDGVPWIAYEYLAGRTLGAVIAAAPLSFAAGLEMAAQVAGALGAAHAAGVIHRDVKAENVMEWAGGRYKLADFGIARWTAAAVKTQTGMLLGTPTHMAPELFRGEEPAPASDLYALGVVLYHAWTGRLPFEAPTLAGLVTAVLGDEPAAPRALVPGLPPAADALVARLLAKRPGSRPESAQALVDALETAAQAPAVAGSGVRVRRGSRARRAADTVVLASPAGARRWWGAAGALLVAAAGVAAWTSGRGGAAVAPASVGATESSPAPAAAVGAVPAAAAAIEALPEALRAVHRALGAQLATLGGLPASAEKRRCQLLAEMMASTRTALELLADAPRAAPAFLLLAWRPLIPMMMHNLANWKDPMVAANMRSLVSCVDRLAPRVNEPALGFLMQAIAGQCLFSAKDDGDRLPSARRYSLALVQLERWPVELRFAPAGLRWRAHVAARALDAGRRGLWGNDASAIFGSRKNTPRAPESREHLVAPAAEVYALYKELSKRYRTDLPAGDERDALYDGACDAVLGIQTLVEDAQLEDFHRTAVEFAPVVIAWCRRVRLCPFYADGQSLADHLQARLEQARAGKD